MLYVKCLPSCPATQTMYTVVSKMVVIFSIITELVGNKNCRRNVKKKKRLPFTLIPCTCGTVTCPRSLSKSLLPPHQELTGVDFLKSCTAGSPAGFSTSVLLAHLLINKCLFYCKGSEQFHRRGNLLGLPLPLAPLSASVLLLI